MRNWWPGVESSHPPRIFSPLLSPFKLPGHELALSQYPRQSLKLRLRGSASKHKTNLTIPLSSLLAITGFHRMVSLTTSPGLRRPEEKNTFLYTESCLLYWCRLRDLNSRPLGCKPSALPTELKRQINLVSILCR